jgi:hypothetical protein
VRRHPKQRVARLLEDLRKSIRRQTNAKPRN